MSLNDPDELQYNDPAVLLADNTTLRRINDELRRKIWGLEQLAADYKRSYEEAVENQKQSDKDIEKCVAYIEKLEAERDSQSE